MEQINQLSSRTCGNLNQVSCHLLDLQQAAVTLGMNTLAAELNEAISILRTTSEDVQDTTSKAIHDMFQSVEQSSSNLLLGVLNAVANKPRNTTAAQ
jgi:hypothetical protein